jgi:hypothetical protein
MKAQLLAGLTAATALTGMLATTGVANAGTLTRTATYTATPEEQVDLTTNYLEDGYGRTDILNSVLKIEKFRAKNQVLKSVTLEFSGDIIGDGGFENRDARNQNITASLLGNLKLDMPDGSSLFNLNPTNARTFDNISRYDGRQDFAGNSGRTFEGLTAIAAGGQTFTDTTFLNQFIGRGTLDFLFSATATSRFTGSGNISSYVDTYARSALMVTYEYEDLPRDIPEPAATAGIGIVAGLGLLSQRKKATKKA